MGNPNGGLRHGHAKMKTPTYKIWRGMRARCNRPKHKDWPNYGGRGVTVCPRWDSYEAFLSDMGERPSPDHTIDRINPRGNYEPENCRWVPRAIQTSENNTRLKAVTIEGVAYHSIAAACRAFGIGRTTVNMRLNDGHDLITAITTPVRGLPNRRTKESYLPNPGTPERKRRPDGKFAPR